MNELKRCLREMMLNIIQNIWNSNILASSVIFYHLRNYTKIFHISNEGSFSIYFVRIYKFRTILLFAKNIHKNVNQFYSEKEKFETVHYYYKDTRTQITFKSWHLNLIIEQSMKCKNAIVYKNIRFTSADITLLHSNLIITFYRIQWQLQKIAS